MAVFAFEQWMMASNTFLVNSFAKKGLKPKWQMVKFCRKPNCSISLSPDRLQYLQLPPFLLKFQMPPKCLSQHSPYLFTITQISWHDFVNCHQQSQTT